MAKRPSRVPQITTKKMFYDLLLEAVEGRGIDPTEYKIHLSILAESFQTYREVQNILSTEGEYVKQLGDKKQDMLKLHPLSKVRDSQRAFIAKELKEYGLTPKSKADLQLVNNEAASAMEQIMKLINGDEEEGEDDTN
ncbi:P27 family phage terminase small subunit [Aeromonas salmonicida]|uniref:P27 family phage terminase small subunit n=1 Tax=Aeromonas TaxID=642 RepID=UPI000378F047|nr:MULTISPECIES: P27 family phage terminase small subunit [Aeromonas]MBL0603797.1 P27 family phage terminase small subunit [Aeromonas dhakensis]